MATASTTTKTTAPSSSTRTWTTRTTTAWAMSATTAPTSPTTRRWTADGDELGDACDDDDNDGVTVGPVRKWNMAPSVQWRPTRVVRLHGGFEPPGQRQLHPGGQLRGARQAEVQFDRCPAPVRRPGVRGPALVELRYLVVRLPCSSRRPPGRPCAFLACCRPPNSSGG